MAIFTVSQTSGFSFGLAGITNIVTAGVTISDTANDAVRSVDDDSHLVNYGNLLSNAPGDFAVEFAAGASNSSIFNGASGVISGITGVGFKDDSDSLTNNGSIDGTDTGVFLGPATDNAYILNHGYIHGGAFGINATSNTDGAVIFNTGTIDSESVGMRVNTALGALATEITNTGTIHGVTHAIDAVVGAFSLINEGTLIGDVVGALSASADTIVNSGNIKGDVHLGGGNDAFNGGGGTSGTIFGEAGNDVLTGGAAGDRIDGGIGNDILTGGSGADHFTFSTALVANVDRITDFKHGVDKFELDHTIFTAAGAAGTTLTAAAFFKGAHAHDASDRIIYNPANGFVYYDSNGNGAGHEAISPRSPTASPSTRPTS